MRRYPNRAGGLLLLLFSICKVVIIIFGLRQDDYISPILDDKISEPRKLQQAISSKNVIVNRNLDTIAKQAGIEANISFHVSTHSFSQYALEEGDMDIYQISKALGHSKIKTTERYLKAFDEELLDEGMEGLFGD